MFTAFSNMTHAKLTPIALGAVLASAAFSRAQATPPGLDVSTIKLVETGRSYSPKQIYSVAGGQILRHGYETVVLQVSTLPNIPAQIQLSSPASQMFSMRLLVGTNEVARTNYVSHPATVAFTLKEGEVASLEIAGIPESRRLTAAESASAPNSGEKINSVPFKLTYGYCHSSNEERLEPRQVNSLVPQVNVKPVSVPPAPEGTGLPPGRIASPSWAERLHQTRLPRLSESTPSRPSAQVPTDRHGNRYLDGGRVVVGPNVDLSGTRISNSGGSVNIGTVRY